MVEKRNWAGGGGKPIKWGRVIMNKRLRNIVLQRGLILLKAIIASKGWACPKKVFPAFRGVFIWTMKELQNKCSCFPEPRKPSWKFEIKDNTKLGRKPGGALAKSDASLDMMVNLEAFISQLEDKPHQWNWPQTNDQQFVLVEPRTQSSPCHFIPLFKEEAASHLPAKTLDSNFISLNDAKQTNPAMSSALLFPVSLRKNLPNLSKNQLVYNIKYSCLMELNLVA